MVPFSNIVSYRIVVADCVSKVCKFFLILLLLFFYLFFKSVNHYNHIICVLLVYL